MLNKIINSTDGGTLIDQLYQFSASQSNTSNKVHLILNLILDEQNLSDLSTFLQNQDQLSFSKMTLKVDERILKDPNVSVSFIS